MDESRVLACDPGDPLAWDESVLHCSSCEDQRQPDGMLPPLCPEHASLIVELV